MRIGLPALLPNLPATPFVRTVWHSEADRKKYERVLSNFNNAWLEAEQLSVLEGIRPLCLQPLSQAEYLAFLPWAHDNGLHVRVKRFAGAFQGFAHYYTPGSDMLVVAMSKHREMAEDPQPEQYLGYPGCCQHFFAKSFPMYVDPILQWADYESYVKADPSCIPTLRSLGIRFVSHIPCSGDCTQTVVLGEHMSRLLPSSLVDAGTEILLAPQTWDCYRGIAIVKTQWFRTIYRSTPYKERVLINING